MKTKITLSMAIGILLCACNASPTENEVSVNKEEVVVAEDSHQEEEEAIFLDNGKKWAVVPEMLAFIRTMEKGVVDFGEKKDAVSADYQELAVLIDDNIRALTANCTMKGQAHDELHKWLVPLLSLSQAFDDAKELKIQEQVYQKIKKSHENFNLYFE
jgi:hypothetical protein